MSADSGPTGGSPAVGDALVAALGFEPTDAKGVELTVDGASVETAVAPPSSEANSADDSSARKTVVAPTPESSESVAGSSRGTEKGRDASSRAGSGSNTRSTRGNGSSSNGSPSASADGAATTEIGDDTQSLVLEPDPTGEFDASGLPDSHSSGVKPIVPAAGEIGETPGPIVGPEFVGEANALLSGNRPVADLRTQPVDVPDGPPLIGDPLAPVGPPLTGSVTSPRMKATENVAERVGNIAARVPKLLEERPFKRTRRVRARKVRRVVRHIDPWSVLTFSVLFHLCVFAALLLSSVLVWNAAVAAGTIENIESFIRELGDYQTYKINGDVVFRAALVITGILTLASSVLVVLLTVVFNLISDLVGGIRFTVVEEETVRVRRKRNQ